MYVKFRSKQEEGVKGQSEVPDQKEKENLQSLLGASTVVMQISSLLGMETSSQYVNQSCINVSHVGYLC